MTNLIWLKREKGPWIMMGACFFDLVKHVVLRDSLFRISHFLLFSYFTTAKHPLKTRPSWASVCREGRPRVWSMVWLGRTAVRSVLYMKDLIYMLQKFSLLLRLLPEFWCPQQASYSSSGSQLHRNQARPFGPHREKRVSLQNTRTSNTRTKRKGRNSSTALNKG